jgi:hypothetical protein
MVASYGNQCLGQVLGSNDIINLNYYSFMTCIQTIMLVVLVEGSAHTIVVYLDQPSVQTGDDPWPLGMESHT